MTSSPSVDDQNRPQTSRSEFIAIMAMLAGTVAFSIDAMLPALPAIAETTGATNNREQLIITVFVLGMGFGTLFSGPISDAIGRRPAVVGGAIIYSVAALVAAMSQSLEVILAARLVQGIGAAGPRVAALSIVRDLYAGRQMAKIVSIIMVVFALIPTFAPSLGALILYVSEWPGIFVSFAVFSAISVAWILLRLPETLPLERRRPFRFAAIASGTAEVVKNRVVLTAIAVQSLVFGILFGALAGSQPMFDQAFGRADTFPFWFGVIAFFSAGSGFLNAAIVERLGMRRVVFLGLGGLAVVTFGYIALLVLGSPEGNLAFGAYVFWQFVVFFNAGLTIGNLNALALEPMGHIAGLAASIVTASGTIFGALMAMPVSIFFDGSEVSVVLPIFVMAVAGVLLTKSMPDRA